MPFLHLLKTCVDNISTITTHFSLWYRHIQNALGAMPITEMLFSVALFRRVSCRCCKAFRIQLQWELQINKAPRPSPSVTKSLQGQALLNYVTISFAALPKTACHKPIQFKVTQAHGWNGTHTSHKARQAHIFRPCSAEKPGWTISHPCNYEDTSKRNHLCIPSFLSGQTTLSFELAGCKGNTKIGKHTGQLSVPKCCTTT